MSDDREERIRNRSYHLWLQAGQPHGRQEEHWAEAERQVAQEQEEGAKMLQVDEAETKGKPRRGSVVPDTRPSEEPENKQKQPPPVHAEKETGRTGRSSAKTASSGGTASANSKTPATPERSESSPATQPRRSGKIAGSPSSRTKN